MEGRDALNAKKTIKEVVRTFGPAWLVMIADVDVASIVTGLQAGAAWGYRMVILMLILTVPLFVIQDVAGTLGTMAGIGLGTAIRRFYGDRVAKLAAIPMAITDVLEYVAEYAGIALGLSLLGLPILPGLVIIFLLHVFIAWTGRYRHAEAFLLPISFLLVAALVASAAALRIEPASALSQMVSPLPITNKSFDYLAAASVGAVIMPWMLFFHSGADARKGLTRRDLLYERLETLVGAMTSEVLMAITVIDGVAIGDAGNYLNPSEMVEALRPFGSFARLVMGVGFISAGFLALVVVSLASAWGVMEALGVERGTNAFRVIYLVESIPALAVVLLTRNLVELMIGLMVSFTILLAPLLYMLGKVASRPDVMGCEALRGWRAAAYWVLSAVVVISGLLALTPTL
ncbi:MAG: NRAMP family divalent metal transporter [Acidilobus sp.]